MCSWVCKKFDDSSLTTTNGFGIRKMKEMERVWPLISWPQQILEDEKGGNNWIEEDFCAQWKTGSRVVDLNAVENVER